MTWRRSSFIGRPEDPFYIMRPSRDNFYVDVIRAIQEALNIVPVDDTLVTPLLMSVTCIAGIIALMFMFNSFSKRSPSRRAGAEQK
jgi:hypothetical protein